MTYSVEKDAFLRAIEVVEELCPHEPDEHPEGCCEVCDYSFAIAADLRELAEEARVLSPVKTEGES